MLVIFKTGSFPALAAGIRAGRDAVEEVNRRGAGVSIDYRLRLAHTICSQQPLWIVKIQSARGWA
jgi:hypothetical protein